MARYALSVASRSRAAPAVYPSTTASVTQLESPEDSMSSPRILRRISRIPPNSLIHGANRSARLNAAVVAVSVGPPSIDRSPRTRSGRRYASRNASDPPIEWAMRRAARTCSESSTAAIRSAWAVSE